VAGFHRELTRLLLDAGCVLLKKERGDHET
jgi:hypothetical protein